jgi:hypothetical protein
MQKMMDAQAKDIETKRLSLIQVKKKHDSMYRMKSQGGRGSQFTSNYKDYHLRASQASENSQ